MFLVKLPNILAFQPVPFEAEYIEELQRDEQPDGQARTENVIRWREGEQGRESNARLVRWSDGSTTLHVGSEMLIANQVPIAEGSTHLYTKHTGSNFECHGVLKKKLQVKPSSIRSSTHRALTKHIAKNHVKEKRMKMTSTTINPETKAKEDEKAWMESKSTHPRTCQSSFASGVELTSKNQ